MAVTLPVLLLTVALPKPSLVWDWATGAEGGIRLRCSAPGPLGGGWFTLHRDGTPGPVAEEQAPARGLEVTFLLPSIGPGERYRCGYWNRDAAGGRVESPLSDPANISSGPDRYPKPSIAVSPGPEVLAGQTWTIRCWAPYAGMSFVLYRAREFWTERAPRGDPPTAEFHLGNASAASVGRYTCYYHTINEPFIWSNASNPLELRVTDVPSTREWFVDVGGKLRVNCSILNAPGGWFFLYRDGDPKPLAWIAANEDDRLAGFNLPEEQALGPSKLFSCRYGLEEPGTRFDLALNDTEVRTQGSRSGGTDYSQTNALRLGLGAAVLLLALLFVAQACWEERHLQS
ncbi:T-cell-interacting, activating receptor on myeloid cells protein 1-like isoform X1 [Chelonoidis abingdonii]|uniref:T-cell-interacting, activating receptor on myeloid cells protein 1-like isoform X1 n=1 Tax=Chelonoidis abingdonii TaxID=106734 RepID=UPI0013F2447B|nr:immunoglobulin superfamily member 1-like isoform X1 [Chelonoidis abingdonii]